MSYLKAAKILPIRLSLESVAANDPNDRAYRYNSTMVVDEQLHSYQPDDLQYDGTDIAVGDYVATSVGGRILKVISISAQTRVSITCVLEDEFYINQVHSNMQDFDGAIAENDGIVFEVHNGRPILFPFPPLPRGGLLAQFATEIQSRFDYVGYDRFFSDINPDYVDDIDEGDLVSWDSVNNKFVKLTGNEMHLATVKEKFPGGIILLLPAGNLIDIELGGNKGDFYYIDNSVDGGVTTTAPATGRIEQAYFQISSSQAIYLAGANITVNQYIDLVNDQTAAGNKTFSDNITINGNLVVDGTTTTISSTNTVISDQLFELGSGRTGAPTGSSGIVIERGDETNVFIGWDESTDQIVLATGAFTGSSTGDLTLTDGSVRIGDVEISNNITVAGTTTLSGTLDVTGDITLSGTAEFDAGTMVVSNSNNTNVQTDTNVLYATTTDDTETELFLDDSSSRIAIPTDTTASFEANIVGRDSDGSQHCAYKLRGLIDNTGDSVALVSNVIEEIIAESDVEWTAVAEADDTNDALVIKVTGETGVTIRWTAFVTLIKVTH